VCQAAGASDLALVALPVAMDTVTLAVAPEPTVTLAGLKLQAALAGSAPQANVNVPVAPPAGLIVIV
jgi:hypothetical protein